MEVVAPELTSIMAWCHLSLEEEIFAERNKAFGRGFIVRIEGGLGRAHSFRVPGFLLVLQDRLTFHLYSTFLTEQLPLLWGQKFLLPCVS